MKIKKLKKVVVNRRKAENAYDPDKRITPVSTPIENNDNTYNPDKRITPATEAFDPDKLLTGTLILEENDQNENLSFTERLQREIDELVRLSQEREQMEASNPEHRRHRIW